MSFARLPSQAPQWDATALAKALKLTDAQRTQLVSWKRYVESTVEFDGAGLRDIVAANAAGLNAVKADLDKAVAANAALTARVASLEAKPAVPFPGSS